MKTIEMFLKSYDEMILTGLEDDDMLEIMRTVGVIAKITENDDMIIYTWTDEDKTKIIDIILHNHDVDNVTENVICYNTVYTFECWE